VEPYQSQAEVFREQLRRMTAPGDESDATTNAGDLLRDLQELEQAGAAESNTAENEASHPQSADGEGAPERSPRDATTTASNTK
jgi:hypothetical protein